MPKFGCFVTSKQTVIYSKESKRVLPGAFRAAAYRTNKTLTAPENFGFGQNPLRLRTLAQHGARIFR